MTALLSTLSRLVRRFPLATVATALVFTGVLAAMPSFRPFGAVTAYANLFVLLAATVVLPGSLTLWDRWHRSRPDTTPGLPRAATVSSVDGTVVHVKPSAPNTTDQEPSS